MFKQTMYSKYQKRVIRFLTDFLGTETPFTYEKTQANHLKVLIDGFPKPMYTGSTPSDRKSIDNFMADVKRELKASKISCTTNDLTQPKLAPAEPIDELHDKLVQNCVKTLRSRLSIIKSKEQEEVLENRSIDGVTSYRNAVIKDTIQANKLNKPTGYIKHQTMKNIEEKVSKHLKFMMPSLAYYSELLESKSKYTKEAILAAIEEQDSTKQAVMLLEKTAKTNPPETLITPAIEPSSAKVKNDQPTSNQLNNSQLNNSQLNSDEYNNNQTSLELMSLPVNKRVNLLRNLTKKQALQLIDDINQAMTLNREQDIAAIVALIKEKDVPLEAIIAKLGEG